MEFIFNKVADCDLPKKEFITVSLERVLKKKFSPALRENRSVPFRSL